MKTTSFKNCISNLPAIVAIVSFVLFTSVKQTDDNNSAVAASQCCSGYSIPVAHLKNCMIDSLSKNQFEGGVYRKKDLLDILNGLPPDSLVYLVNVLKDSLQCRKTNLAITTSSSDFVYFVGRSARSQCNVNHCPLPCCSQRVYASRLERCCINYQPYKRLNEQNELITLSSPE